MVKKKVLKANIIILLLLNFTALCAATTKSENNPTQLEPSRNDQGGELDLSEMFSDGMVLQKSKLVPVWGFGETGNLVTVGFKGQEFSATVKSGRWMVFLTNADRYGGPYVLTVRQGDHKRVLKNVLVGEVWLAAGQSNMNRALKATQNGLHFVKSATNSNIRLFLMPACANVEEIHRRPGTWKECSPENISEFSAVAYHFARNLGSNLNVPIGIIQCSWGGTMIQTWMPYEVLKTNSQFSTVIETYQKVLSNYPTVYQKYLSNHTLWKTRLSEAKRNNLKLPAEPEIPLGPLHKNRPGGLFEAMFSRIVPYEIKGILWYQGESNRDEPILYEKLFTGLIQYWRHLWNKPLLPVLFVQLPILDKENGTTIWDFTGLRESQLNVFKKTPHTAMIETMDLGERFDVHPSNKEPVGYRLSLAARHIAYGEAIEYSGPIFDSVLFTNNTATIYFCHTTGGLICKGDKLKGFSLCGDDHIFYKANAEIRGHQVIASSHLVKNPIALRYGFERCPDLNFYNQAGLPASPFRTDTFAWAISDPKGSGALFDLKSMKKQMSLNFPNDQKVNLSARGGNMVYENSCLRMSSDTMNYFYFKEGLPYFGMTDRIVVDFEVKVNSDFFDIPLRVFWYNDDDSSFSTQKMEVRVIPNNEWCRVIIPIENKGVIKNLRVEVGVEGKHTDYFRSIELLTE